MITIDKKINTLIHKCIKTKKVEFPIVETEGYSLLLDKKILLQIESNPKFVKLNPNSIEFNKTLLKIAEDKLKRKIPKSIIEALSFVEDFQEKLKEENGIAKDVINGYGKLIRGLQGYILYKLHSDGFDIKKYFLNELKPKEDRENELFLFEQHIYRFLPYSKYSAKEIWKICQKTLASNDRYYVDEFARNLASNNFKLAKDIYSIAIKSEQPNNTFFIASLLIGLQNNGLEVVYEKAFELQNKHPQQGYHVLSSLKNLSNKQNVSIFQLVSNDHLPETVGSKTQVICSLIDNVKVSEELRRDCFNLITTYLQQENKESVKIVFHRIIYSLKSFEAEKYKLLHIYLENTHDFSVIESFFYNYENPEYLFHLMKMFYKAGWQRGAINQFESSIYHFWNNDTQKTEKQILELFRPEDKFGMLPVEIIMTGSFGAIPIDLLKLKTKRQQAKAIEAITLFPHNFDRLLPVVLPLRQSPYPEVIKFLQIKLSELIYDAYHKSLLDDIENLLDESKEDKAFVRPLKKVYKNYEFTVLKKKSINDLNPYENERDLMDLYYSLEHENRAKMMQDINENPKGILAAVGKSTIIVRGNSWKQELEDKIMQLGKVESSFILDARLFKNPDLQEYILNNYDKR
ncbi:MAG: hypothetical protein V7724_07225 [Sediminicola sp.]